MHICLLTSSFWSDTSVIIERDIYIGYAAVSVHQAKLEHCCLLINGWGAHQVTLISTNTTWNFMRSCNCSHQCVRIFYICLISRSVFMLTLYIKVRIASTESMVLHSVIILVSNLVTMWQWLYIYAILTQIFVYVYI